MNVLSARIVLRERNILDVFDLALRFLGVNALRYALVSAIVLVPIGIIGGLIAHFVDWPSSWIWTLPAGMLAQAPFTALASRLVFEETASLKEVLGLAIRRLPSLLVVRFFQLAGMAACSFFFVPSIWIGTIYLFGTEVTVLERSGPFATTSRLQRLVSGQFGSALVTGILLVPIHVTAVIAFDQIGRIVLSTLFEITAPASMIEAGGSVLALVGYLALIPFVATARFLSYINLRTRTEGWDIQTRFTAIASRTAEEPAIA